MEESSITPELSYNSEFEFIKDNFQKALLTAKSDSILILTILFIYIGVLGKMIYPEMKEKLAAANLLKSIDVKYPFLCWHIFRNGCAHNFTPNSIKIDKNSIGKISWGFVYSDVESMLNYKSKSYTKVDQVVKIGGNLIYNIYVKYLLSNLLLFLENQDTTELKTPSHTQSLVEIKERNRNAYNEIEEICNSNI